MSAMEHREPKAAPGFLALAGYCLLGAYFGLVLTKSEAISWFRIQEMFRFQGFHMFGLLGSGVAVAMVSLALIRRFHLRALNGEPIEIPPKARTPGLVRYWAGGTVFGLGWALLGACPGPLYALVGSGVSVYLVAILAALAGTWAYGYLHESLPH
jgi:uncharacterized membrane protein YedE/YeeE